LTVCSWVPVQFGALKKTESAADTVPMQATTLARKTVNLVVENILKEYG
jgi:hypothetical protein